jgi:adenylosuccinate synthase
MRLTDARRVIVVDLGFGDAGKGTVTDALVRRLGAGAVVRFNGGAQAGHTVVTEDGRTHTFAQLGAGTFVRGVRTFLSRDVVVHPTALLVEAAHLAARSGVTDALDRLVVSEECLITTPVHQAAVCLRELARGAERHGSCGVGVGETMLDALANPREALQARDLHDASTLATRVLRQQEAKRAELAEVIAQLSRTKEAGEALRMLTDPEVASRWAERATELARRGVVRSDASLRTLLRSDERVIFEGAQGVLLDEWYGFHPHTTWSTCTWANAEALLAAHESPHAAYRLGVLRTCASRHGRGPFPTESREVPPLPTREHNVTGPWQGEFRDGWFDAVLSRYALRAAGAAHGLALTQLDRMVAGATWRVAVEHTVPGVLDTRLFELGVEGRVRDLRVGPAHDLAHTEALGRALFQATPHYRTVALERPDVVIPAIVESELGVRVVLTSSGPTARTKRILE